MPAGGDRWGDTREVLKLMAIPIREAMELEAEVALAKNLRRFSLATPNIMSVAQAREEARRRLAGRYDEKAERKALELYQAMVAAIVKEVARGDVVNLQGFASFSTRKTAARSAVLNGKVVMVPATVAPVAAFGAAFRFSVAQGVG